MRKYSYIGLFVYWIICLLLPQTVAAMENNNYTLEKQDVEIQPFRLPTPKPAEKQKQQKTPPLASGENYLVTTNAESPFSLNILQSSLNFGQLTATNPIIRRLNLNILSPEGYQIFAGENQPLTQGKVPIPDTTCDSGLCTEITPALWTSTLTYGFGYHTSNMAENEYMQFADLSKNEPLELIFQADKSANSQLEVLYKVNIAGTQQPGGYGNVVTFISTPDY